MSFWDRLWKKPAPSPSQAEPHDAAANAPEKARPDELALPNEPARPDEPALPNELSVLLRLGSAHGAPSEEDAAAAFLALRSTTSEPRAVSELARIARTERLPDSLLVLLGTTLLERGELESAANVLAPATSPAALVLRADLAERRLDIAAALALVERVLLRDLDHPGARERHRRWRAELGFDRTRAAPTGATVVARAPDAPFDLLREVGRGGAAAVYEAVDRELGRHVALKVYHHPERDRSQLAHESRVAVALEGPGIVRVFDVDPVHGWIALEWAPLGALRDRIGARDAADLLPIERWAIPLAHALARVHGAGWVHHDVKPANVVLSRAKSAILTDFGTARRFGEPSPPGSLGYVSPERIQGRPSHPRDDVYGLGRVLEDALATVTDERTLARFRPIAEACTGSDGDRPEDGRALLALLHATPRIGAS